MRTHYPASKHDEEARDHPHQAAQQETYGPPPDEVRSRHQRQPPCRLAALAANSMVPSKTRCTPKAETTPTWRPCSSLGSPPTLSKPSRWDTSQKGLPPSRPAPVDGESCPR